MKVTLVKNESNIDLHSHATKVQKTIKEELIYCLCTGILDTVSGILDP